MKPIITIARRELSGYFASPVAFVFIVIFLLLSGFFTFMVAGFFDRGQANLEAFFAWHPWLYLFLVPAVGMRVWSTVNYLGNPDNGVIFASYLGSFLMGGAYLAITAMTSAMTRNQVVAFIVSVVLALFLILAGYPPVTNLLVTWAKPWLVEGIAAFSVMTHFESIQKLSLIHISEP